MCTVPFGTSRISGVPRFWTGAPCWLGKSPNIQRDDPRRFVVGYARSASCWSDDCASHFASDKTHLTNSSGDRHAWPQYLTIGNIWKDTRRTPNKRAWILVGLIPYPPKGAKNIDETWHSVVGTVLSPLRNLDITGPGLKWFCADGFQRQCYPLLAAWVGDYPEQVMVAQVSYGSCAMCEIPKGATIRAFNFSTTW
jgi:hypothetical protein